MVDKLWGNGEALWENGATIREKLWRNHGEIMETDGFSNGNFLQY